MDKPYKRRSIQIPNELYDNLEADAEANRRSLSSQVVVILESHYSQKPTYKFLTDRDAAPSQEDYFAALKRLNDSLPDEIRLSPNELDIAR